MNNIFTYSNGWGHLIITIFFATLGAVLILYPGATSTTVGIGVMLITTSSGAWFIPGAAKQMASEVAKASSGPLPSSLNPAPKDTPS
jgi:UPF0716 family protein affecting phage T7 exclusion